MANTNIIPTFIEATVFPRKLTLRQIRMHTSYYRVLLGLTPMERRKVSRSEPRMQSKYETVSREAWASPTQGSKEE